MYWVDTGFLCHLLGIETKDQLLKSSFLGSIFEGHWPRSFFKAWQYLYSL
ncbi:MAG: hypothetical protein HQK50_17915 [Oligoflexia bacterium]|nr:hypothetical protein [Oligoflexia bacterium]